ncbi:hypothetical protein MATL_G00025000 [Megalops atlanticus]|uniref:RAB6-interacting golgin n=1 Tax=Megalops atlanticus TaxID=7932 RepID=A0A9D3TCF5_MEGAT|nr:hypothetical protein MATL_G00025000 [Megalops atlanticus]
MAGWAGFSDEELRRLQQKDQNTAGVVGRGRKTAPTNRSRQQLQRERVLQLASQKQQDGAVPILPEQQLAKPKAQAPRPTQEQEPPGSTSSHQQEAVAVTQSVVASTETVPVPMATELETQEVELREKTRLEQLQQEQRIIEEKNKRKKALLAKTIAEKSKQTQAEAVKLKRIQKELQALDDMVSNDIGILRGKIEQASWDYSTARKRYDKAEAEYVSAKLDLHKKTEVKEQLTEHLYTIIQENEQRKARKLEELMQQLELQADEERLELEIQVEKMLQQQQEEEAQHAQGKGPLAGSDLKGDGTPQQEDENKNGPLPQSEPNRSDQDCSVPGAHPHGEPEASAS